MILRGQQLISGVHSDSFFGLFPKLCVFLVKYCILLPLQASDEIIKRGTLAPTMNCNIPGSILVVPHLSNTSFPVNSLLKA